MSQNEEVRVCITGGTGFVGLSLSSLLIRRGCEVTLLTHERTLPPDLAARPNAYIVQCDLLDFAKVRKYMSGQDCLIHNSIIWSDEDEMPASGDFESSICLFQAAAEAHVKRVVYTSSTAVHRPFKPFMTALDEVEPYDAYAFVKSQNELLLATLSEKLGFEGTVIRPGPVVGGPAYEGEKLKVGNQINRIFNCALDNSPIRLDEEVGRQFIGRDDLAKVFLAAIQPKAEPGTYIAAADNLTTWESIARLIVEKLDSKSEIIPSGNQAPECRFDTMPLIKKLGLRFNSEASVAAMIDSMTSEYSSGPFSL